MATRTLPPPGTRRAGAATGSPSRRDALTAGIFTALTGIAAAAIAKPDQAPAKVLASTCHADAELLALADRFMTLQVKIDALNDMPDDHEDQMDALIDAQVPLLDDIDDTPAMGLAGHRARIRVLMAWYGMSRDSSCAHVIEWKRLQPLFLGLLDGGAADV